MELLDIKECEVTVRLDLETCRALAWELGRARRQHEYYPLTDALVAFFEAAAMASAVYSEHDDKTRAALPFRVYREKVEEYGRRPGASPAA